MHRLLLIVVILTALVCEKSFAEGDAAEGKIKAYTCSGCHGIPGYKNAYPNYHVPRLGGQNTQYLKNALEAYRSGNRLHPTMRNQAESLSARDIADIVSSISMIELQSPVTETESQGSAPDKIQMCQSCHGNDGRGIDESYPVLAGQHSSYLERALLDYRNGDRKNAVMGGFAGMLTDAEIAELAKWYASMAGLKVLPAE
jgi:cytochrome c553